MDRFVCIHGHFYQPPRENPWLEEVELQESALPFHDWNQRVSAECYARNGASRILNNRGQIVEIVNNYSRISFNIGPTLLSWMEKKDPDTYQAVLEADRLSRERFSGHGAAMAQVYNHMIMPLANSRDKRTQIIWGIRDFQSRYQRMPEGMWLAETAVDLESLDIMAEQGIKFTVLAPHQARRTRKIPQKKQEWTAEDEEHLDPRRPYLCRLPSGRTIAIFFYDGPISQAVAFEGLLHNGEAFAGRLLGGLDRKNTSSQLVHIATDGESYGHHHKFGDMALAYCLKHIEETGQARLTVYGEYLEKHPPEYEAEIIENSSWSCYHGIERWRDDCGCNSGGKPEWNQAWRGPLRSALDWLRDRAASSYEREMREYDLDVWALRDDFIEVILDRSPEHMRSFLAKRIRPDLPDEAANKILRCLEAQRNALLMYTSCGWFFDDISGIETVQIIKYAARVIQLVRRVTGEDLELGFIELLGKARSNVPDADNGARIYKLYVEPSVVDILRVGAHYAMSSLYQKDAGESAQYCFAIRDKVYDRQSVGKMNLVVGRSEIRSRITWTTFDVQFVVVHLGDHNFITGVDYFRDEEQFGRIRREIVGVFAEGDVPRALQVINRHFGAKNYTLWHLFQQEQKIILDKIFESTMLEIETSFRRIYEDHFSLIRMINENHMPLPKILSGVVEFVLNRDIERVLEMDQVPLEKLQRLVREMSRWPFKRDKQGLDFIGGNKINVLMLNFSRDPENVELLSYITEFLRLLTALHRELDVWRAQNLYYAIGQTRYRQKKAAGNDEVSRRWVEAFESLGELLKVKII